jgi:hypothetical protein
MAKKAHRVKRRIGSRCGEKVCFHGAFVLKSHAKQKAEQLKGARIKFVHLKRGGWRYAVLTSKKKKGR